MILQVRTRVTAVILLIALVGLVSSLWVFHRVLFTADPLRNRPNVSLHEKRFAPLRKFLPRNGVVGYISDKDPEVADLEFGVARYILAPVIIVRSTETELVIGSLRRPPLEIEAAPVPNLTPLKDFGDGVVLFQREVR